MRTIKYIFLLLGSVFIFTACDEDNFSQVVTIDLPEHTPLPAIDLRMSAGSTSFSALISNSKGILQPDSSSRRPADAEVTVLRDGVAFLEWNFDPLTRLYTAESNVPWEPQVGERYDLSVSVPGFETVTSTQTILSPPEVITGTYEVDGGVDSEGFRGDEIVVDVKDTNPNELGYYALQVFVIFPFFDQDGNPAGEDRFDIFIDTDDPLISYGGSSSLIFTDEQFADDKYKIRALSYSSWGGSDVRFEVEVTQLSLDAFLYERSLGQYVNAIDNPFAEPVTVHSNIEGGYGIFTATNRTVIELEEI